MSEKSIDQLAESYGLTLETAILAEHDKAFRVFKGANQVFIGTETAVLDFLNKYDKDRPSLLEGSMYGYRE